MFYHGFEFSCFALRHLQDLNSSSDVVLSGDFLPFQFLEDDFLTDGYERMQPLWQLFVLQDLDSDNYQRFVVSASDMLPIQLLEDEMLRRGEDGA